MGEALTKCPICSFPGIKQHPRGGSDMFFMQCQRCGEYEISWEFIHFADVNSDLKKVGYILSGLARELHETGDKYPSFT